MYIPKKLIPSAVPPAKQTDAFCSGIFTLSAQLINSDKPTPHIDFLIDTGSCLSILPRKYAKSDKPTGCLRAANGSEIPTFGIYYLTFTLPNSKDSFTWPFTIADTLQPILGADFFERFGFLVDCRNHAIIPTNEFTPIKNNTLHNISKYDCFTIFSNSIQPDLQHLATNFESLIPTLFPNCITKSSSCQSNNTVSHSIPTTPSQPYRTKKRDLPIIKRQAVEEEFKILEATGVIRRSSSPWASAIHVVTKPDGSFRPCGDYRYLNSITIHDAYPMPLITDILNNLHGQQIFSKIDLKKAFHQIPVAIDDIPKTAVITPFGLFEYLMMPFGLRNAAQSFQRHIDNVLSDCPFSRPYLDDILVFSPDLQTHKSHLSSVLKKLNDHNLVINLKKCTFFAEEVQFLGHLLSHKGIRPLPSKLETIALLKLPKTVTNLRSFLGAVNFYHRFIPNASSLLAVLTSLATGPKTANITWSDAAISSFEKIKVKLSDLVSLKYYNPEAELQLTTDASDFAIGAVLNQVINGIVEPLEFFSKKLNNAQKNYSAFDRELLAIHDAVKHFQNLLDGRTFEIITDHKPLLYLNSLKTPSPRQLRHITFLSEFNFNISHLWGKNNVVADFFSRPDLSSIYRTSLFSDTPLKNFKLDDLDLAVFKDNCTIIDDSYYDTSIPGCPRPILPVELRRKAFDSIHKIHHPGAHNSFNLMHTRFIWPSMRKDIKLWCQECIPCQQQKVTRHIRPPIIHFPTGNRFETLHLDIVGPLPASQGKSYILTMIDRKTRWPEAVPISNIAASTVAKHLIDTWFSRYGIPDNIITDQGTQFESDLFKSLSDNFGFKHIHTTTYHPQSNGMIERFHRSLKTSLRCLTITPNWVSSLPLVLLGWRNTIHSATGTSPAQLLFGIGTTFPEEFINPTKSVSLDSLDIARRHFLENDTNPSFNKSSSYKSYVPSTLRTCKFVWLQAKNTSHMKPRYVGPFKLLEFKNNNTVVILRNERPYTINIDKIKPAFGFDEEPELTIQRNETPCTSVPASLSKSTDQSTPCDKISSHPLLTDNKTPSIDNNADSETNQNKTKSKLSSKLVNSDNSIVPTFLKKNSNNKKVTFSQWSLIHHPNYPPDLPKRLERTKS